MTILGVDTGGTFTDFIYTTPDGVAAYKTLSTPHNPSEAVVSGLKHIVSKLGLGDTLTDHGFIIIHGSTVATNAILERKGVPTALVTNAGFTDVIEIGRQNRTELYNLKYKRAPHIVPAELRFGVPGRVTNEGTVVEPFDHQRAAEVIKQIQASGAESVAVCFLFSFLQPDHEKEMGQMLNELGIPVSLSHQILAEFREFERTSTTVVNAYVSPIMSRYLTDLTTATQGNGLRIMQSNGGSISAETAMRESVRTILSGPAGGAVGALEIGKSAGFDKLITFDMGGTSTDVSLMDGQLPLTMESSISGYPVKVPMIDIHTVGAGGGSIASLDSGGSLCVGPESAGAAPGPICYGRGGTGVTVTDANLYLGHIVPDHFLGGGMNLHTEQTVEQLEAMADELSLSPVELAEGILSIANANMERAIRVISVEKGFDPREFTLFSFGGAGGMHCVDLARLLGMARVFIPVNPGILSAIGMLMADVVKDYSRTIMTTTTDLSRDALESLFTDMERQGESDIVGEGIQRESVTHERLLDMRYKGQSFEIIAPYGDNLDETFQVLHEKQYGHRNPDKEIEVVNVRLRSRGVQEKPSPTAMDNMGEELSAEAIIGNHKATFDSTAYDTAIINREALQPGNRFTGPSIIVEYTSTIVVPPKTTVRVDGYLNLILELD